MLHKNKTHHSRTQVHLKGLCFQISVQDVAMLDPKSKIEGGRRYCFCVDAPSSRILFQRCFARNGRHSFVSGARVPGPIVFTHCVAVSCHNDDGTLFSLLFFTSCFSYFKSARKQDHIIVIQLVNSTTISTLHNFQFKIVVIAERDMVGLEIVLCFGHVKSEIGCYVRLQSRV